MRAASGIRHRRWNAASGTAVCDVVIREGRACLRTLAVFLYLNAFNQAEQNPLANLNKTRKTRYSPRDKGIRHGVRSVCTRNGKSLVFSFNSSVSAGTSPQGRFPEC